ncbi:MAG TPA: thermonuclease family protein [Pirellulales bacterium]|nr:thermonuclease family protein [Pirellulales bacterium]
MGVAVKNSATPELSDEQLEHCAVAARAFLQAQIGARPVRVQYDRERLGKDQIPFGYALARDPSDGREVLLNEALIAAGWAVTDRFAYFNDSHKRQFRQAEERAQKANLGLWKLAANHVGDVADDPSALDSPSSDELPRANQRP